MYNIVEILYKCYIWPEEARYFYNKLTGEKRILINNEAVFKFIPNKGWTFKYSNFPINISVWNTKEINLCYNHKCEWFRQAAHAIDLLLYDPDDTSFRFDNDYVHKSLENLKKEIDYNNFIQVVKSLGKK